jgi:Bacterial Ig-like domain (group 3)
VIRAPSTTTLTASAEPSAFGSAVSFAATVAADNLGAGQPAATGFCTALNPPPCTVVPTGSVTFTLDGLPVGQALTLAGATATTRPITGLAPGAHQLTVSYSGDGFFLPSTGSLTHSVRCGVTVTGTVSTPVTVTGSACFTNAVVGGPVTVPSGTAVAFSASRVEGALLITGATGVRLCGTTVAGRVTVANSSGAIEFGNGGDDGSIGCAGNVIGGPLSLTGNSGWIELAGNQVSGPVSVSGNTVTETPLEGSSLELESNAIDGPLSCSTNSPAPSNDGQPNSVTGPRSGQCGTSGF